MSKSDFLTLLEDTKELSAVPQAVIIKMITARAGFDFVDAESAFEKLEEEMSELKEAIKKNDDDSIFEEMGDVCFMLANVAEKLRINTDEALKKANEKFIKRFTYIVKAMEAENLPLTKDNIAKMYEFWELAKWELEKKEL